MKISKIKCENFRNFYEPLEITFPTDGGVTIIYGPNGVGKTTLHQLFQWIIYGVVHFNKTSSDQMYNIPYAMLKPVGSRFKVTGSIDFQHPNKDGVVEYFSLNREWIYLKEKKEIRLENKKFTLTKLVGSSWKVLSNDPEAVVEQILPIGLSQYFFFDGESMIADLNQTGRASAKQLRKALYSIFDLDIYEQAQIHIGTQTGGSTTVLGSLYDERSKGSTDQQVILARGAYRQAQSQVEKLTEDIATCERNINEKKQEIRNLSEKIGSNTSKKALEDQRKIEKNSIKDIEKMISFEMKYFGNDVMRVYPELFISRIVEEAKVRIGLKIEDEKLLPGLTKDLVLALLNEPVCLCGTCIGDKERAKIKELEKKFPPLSYKYIYDQFKASAARWSTTYDKDLLIKHIATIQEYRERIQRIQARIHEIDEDLKNGDNVDDLIADRAKAEESLLYWERKRKSCDQELGLKNQILKQNKKKLDQLLAAAQTNRLLSDQIEVMEAVRRYFETKLETSAEEYSKRLNEAIQDLVDKMLISKRKVFLTPKFELSVKDSVGNEYKSEGQFAVVSFAYIGGIFKLLSEVEQLKGKEYPLVLDGPFSKLDTQHRQNVIDIIPSYAPQVILFSKDDINECFNQEKLVNIWTIFSNDERNLSTVKEGYFPEVFQIDGIHE